MSEPLIWIVGGGGLLGSHMRWALSRHLPRGRIWQSTPARFSWSDPAKLANELTQAVADFAVAVRCQGKPWALLWCAGNGTLRSPAADLEPEWSTWARLLDLLGSHLVELNSNLPGHIFLASSAGGIYGTNASEMLTEDTPPRPVSEYGRHKLRMEVALHQWSEAFSNMSSLVGRISTLYGPGQDLSKPQGIISHLSRGLIYRRPLSIYVPLDTRRDYFFVGDCADLIAACIARLINERSRVILKIMASERLTSLAQIVGIILRIAKHRSLIVSRQAHVPQSMSLKLRSNVWRELGSLRRTDLAAGIHLLHAYQMGLYQRGLLPPPE